MTWQEDAEVVRESLSTMRWDEKADGRVIRLTDPDALAALARLTAALEAAEAELNDVIVAHIPVVRHSEAAEQRVKELERELKEALLPSIEEVQGIYANANLRQRIAELEAALRKAKGCLSIQGTYEIIDAALSASESGEV